MKFRNGQKNGTRNAENLLTSMFRRFFAFIEKNFLLIDQLSINFIHWEFVF